MHGLWGVSKCLQSGLPSAPESRASAAPAASWRPGGGGPFAEEGGPIAVPGQGEEESGPWEQGGGKTPWWPACLPGPREPGRRVKHWRRWRTQLAAVQGQAGSRHPAQLAPSGSCTQWMPVFTDTAVAFVHSSLKHQLEDAGRGRGLPDGDMAAKQAGLPSSGQGGREAAPGSSLPPVALTWPSCRG